MAINQWLKCSVTKINMMVIQPAEIDTFTVRCSMGQGRTPMTYQAIADSKHIRRAAAQEEVQAEAKSDSAETKQTKSADVKPAVNRQSSSATVPRGCPSDEQVKQVLLAWLEAADKQDSDSKTSVTLDSTIRRAGLTSRYYKGIGNKTVCPVKVDYTATPDHHARVDVYHWKGGVYEFYKNDFGEWKFALGEQPRSTRDEEKSIWK